MTLPHDKLSIPGLAEAIAQGRFPSRKDFLSTAGSAWAAAWLASVAPLLTSCATGDVDPENPFATFTDREGADFEAFAARILPTTDTPGAREAGSVYFADRALAGPLSELLPIVRPGLEWIAERAAADHPGGGAFSDLNEASQDEIITAIETENPGFFFFARTLVMLGFVTNPEYGGNRDKVGWAVLGFEDTFGYQPPFGFYDQGEHDDLPGPVRGE